ncbi:MAG: hypothetical protein IPN62_16540 [Flavobacteriales bacterium]|nr:hypothetical protein [Flavobacteriales bacterium]
MAFTSGTIAGSTAAANHYALLDAIHTFCTTALGAYNWTDIKYETQVGSSPDTPYNRKEWMFIAPGMSGDTEIFGGIRTRTAGAYANFEIAGYFGNYGASPSWNTDFEVQPFSRFEHVTLWNDQMDYWLMANGERLLCVVRAGTAWTMFYIGLFRPYSSPTVQEYAYPFFLGGTNDSFSAQISDLLGHRHFAAPVQNACSLWLPSAKWIDVYNRNTTADGYAAGAGYITPTSSGLHGASNSSQPDSRANSDGTFNLVALELVTTDSLPSVLGKLDGVNWVSGLDQNGAVVSPGTIISISGQNYLLIPNISRTAWYDWAAVRLS